MLLESRQTWEEEMRRVEVNLKENLSTEMRKVVVWWGNKSRKNVRLTITGKSKSLKKVGYRSRSRMTIEKVKLIAFNRDEDDPLDLGVNTYFEV